MHQQRARYWSNRAVVNRGPCGNNIGKGVQPPQHFLAAFQTVTVLARVSARRVTGAVATACFHGAPRRTPARIPARSSDRIHVDLYTRQPDDHWLLTSVNRLEDSLALDSVGARLTLSDLYEKVVFIE